MYTYKLNDRHVCNHSIWYFIFIHKYDSFKIRSCNKINKICRYAMMIWWNISSATTHLHSCHDSCPFFLSFSVFFHLARAFFSSAARWLWCHLPSGLDLSTLVVETKRNGRQMFGVKNYPIIQRHSKKKHKIKNCVIKQPGFSWILILNSRLIYLWFR